MSFDFHASFAGHSNVQLLTIILRKELYDESAVQAAEEILRTRDVSDEDRAAAEEIVLQKIQDEEKRMEQRKALTGRIQYTIRDFLFPARKSVTWFLKVFSVVWFALWVIHMIRWPYYYRGFFIDPGFWEVFLLLLEAINLLMVYWVFRINKKGWMLAMVYFIIQLGMNIDSFFAFYRSQWLFKEHSSGLVFQTILSGALIYYFNRKEVRIVFNVSRNLHRDIVIIGCILALLITVGTKFT